MNMARPCRICETRKKERKLRRELSKLKKESQQIDESNEETRKEILMLVNNCNVLDEYLIAIAARARARMTVDAGSFEDVGEREGEEEREEEAMDLS